MKKSFLRALAELAKEHGLVLLDSCVYCGEHTTECGQGEQFIFTFAPE